MSGWKKMGDTTSIIDYGNCYSAGIISASSVLAAATTISYTTTTNIPTDLYPMISAINRFKILAAMFSRKMISDEFHFCGLFEYDENSISLTDKNYKQYAIHFKGKVDLWNYLIIK